MLRLFILLATSLLVASISPSGSYGATDGAAAHWEKTSQSTSNASRRDTYDIKSCYYYRQWGRYPLRYGNSSFGYRHIKRNRGWSARRVDQFVGYVGRNWNRYSPQGGRLVFRHYRHRVEKRVVISLNRPPRGPGRVKGVLTAYQRRMDRGERRRGHIPPNSPGPGAGTC